MLQRLSLFLDRYPGPVALLAGAVSATGFAPLGLWPLTLVALAGLIHLIYQSVMPRRAFVLGWLFGFGHFALSLNWIATAFTFQAAMPAALGWVAVLLLSLYLALFPGLASLIAWWGARRLSDGGAAPLVLPLLFAATWIVTEWLRSWLFTGFAWNPLAAIAPWAAQPTTVIGTYGQSGLVIMVAALIAVAVRREWRTVRTLSGTVAATLLALWSASALHMFFLPASPLPTERDAIRVTIVQPNIEQGDKWDTARRRANFLKLARLSGRSADAPPRLLLWPEAAVPDYLEGGYPIDWYTEQPASVRARLSNLLGPDDLLLTGAVRLEPNAGRTDIVGARNSLFTLDARAQLGPRYDKAHLVPYGEYLPMRRLLEPLGLSRLAPGAVDFWAGPGARTLDLGRFGNVGVQICYEIIFSGQVVDRANRPDFIFNPSNDAWFGSWGPPQHLAQARLRAIEEGLPVVRATPTGISAIIDDKGALLRTVAMHSAGRIDDMLPPPGAPTPFSRAGNFLALLFAAVLALLAVAVRAARR